MKADPHWGNNEVQFARLLHELSISWKCGYSIEQGTNAVAESLSIPVAQVEELFERAEEVWRDNQHLYVLPCGLRGLTVGTRVRALKDLRFADIEIKQGEEGLVVLPDNYHRTGDGPAILWSDNRYYFVSEEGSVERIHE